MILCVSFTQIHLNHILVPLRHHLIIWLLPLTKVTTWKSKSNIYLDIYYLDFSHNVFWTKILSLRSVCVFDSKPCLQFYLGSFHTSWSLRKNSTFLVISIHIYHFDDFSWRNQHTIHQYPILTHLKVIFSLLFCSRDQVH